MDINLLKDTERAEEKRKKTPSASSKPEMTNPEKIDPPKPEPKLPSRFSMWLQSLRGNKQQQEKPEESPVEQVLRAPSSPSFRESSKADTEDIFADLDVPSATPQSSPEPQQPEQPRNAFSMPEVKDTPPAKPHSVKPPSFPQASQPVPPPPVKEKSPAPPELPKKKPKASKQSSGRDQSFLVNLLPAEFQRSIDPRSRLISLAITMLTTALLIGAVYGGLTLYRTSILEEIQSLRTERSIVESNISNLRPTQREAIATKERTDLISTLLNQHVYWTRFFEKLEEYTIDDVYYVGAFNGSLGGQITLSAIGTSFSAPARQLIAFQQADDFLTDVRITSARSAETTSTGELGGGTGVQQISFSISLTLRPDLFYYDASTFPLERIGSSPAPVPVNGGTSPSGFGEPELDTIFPGNTNTSGGTNTNSTGPGSSNTNTSGASNSNSSGSSNTNSTNVNNGTNTNTSGGTNTNSTGADNPSSSTNTNENPFTILP